MEKLRADDAKLYRYVEKIKNPFDTAGGVHINLSRIRPQLKKKRIPCIRKFTRNKIMKARKFCSRLRRIRRKKQIKKSI